MNRRGPVASRGRLVRERGEALVAAPFPSGFPSGVPSTTQFATTTEPTARAALVAQRLNTMAAA